MAQPALLSFTGNVTDHVRVHIYGVNPSLSPNRVRESKREVSAAGADVGHGVARFQCEGLQHTLRLLPFIAARAGVRVALACGGSQPAQQSDDCDQRDHAEN